MSVSDLCYVCSEEAVARCEQCGGAVCDEHHVAAKGVCVRCAGGRTLEG